MYCNVPDVSQDDTAFRDEVSIVNVVLSCAMGDTCKCAVSEIKPYLASQEWMYRKVPRDGGGESLVKPSSARTDGGQNVHTFDDSFAIRQVLPIFIVWQSISSNDPVEFFLCLGLNFWVTYHEEEEHVDDDCCLYGPCNSVGGGDLK